MEETKFDHFRNIYPTMTYEKYTYTMLEDKLRIQFDFKYDDTIKFEHVVEIPKKNFAFHNLDKLDTLIFNIGMVEMISYWKPACPPTIIVKAGTLSEEQKKWWRKLFYRGLGEFMYVNSVNVSEEEFVKIVNYDESKPQLPKCRFNTTNGNIIPVGGGKDSLVTLELLSKYKEKNLCLVMNPKVQLVQGIRVAGYEDDQVFEIHRRMTENLFELNKTGYMNGHTPFSAMLGFYTILVGALTNRRYIALSNESSANESTVKGSFVNHQYSKTFEFEQDFRKYVFEYLTEDIEYFSILRGFSELKIMQIFSQYEKYFDVFRSCNLGSRVNIGEQQLWCGKCAKCLFVFVIMSAFVDYDRVVKIFGNDMLNDEELLETFKGLLGLSEVKPFECVGTREEVNIAIAMIFDRLSKSGYQVPSLLKFYEDNAGELKKTVQDAEEFLKKYDKENNVPEEFLLDV